MHTKSNILILEKIANDYFNCLSSHYPVMCMSDEFHFLPRAKKSIEYLHLLDSLDKDRITEDIAYITGLRNKLDKLDISKASLDSIIDYTVLRQSMSSFLIEFGQAKVWQNDPTIYLKLILLAIDQLTRIQAFSTYDMRSCLLSRLAQIPRLLNEIKINLGTIPLAHLKTSVDLINASIKYFGNYSIHLSSKSTSFQKDFDKLMKNIKQALSDLKKFLRTKPTSSRIPRDRKVLEDTLKHSFSSKMELEEIFDISKRAYHKTLKEMDIVAKGISPEKSWQRILSECTIKAKDVNGLLNLYSKQIGNIKTFLKKKNILTIPEGQKIAVRKTPEFMVPVRASASYSAPISVDPKESGFFYLTPYLEHNAKTKKPEFSNIHLEYIFVTAHETFPGHHLLDYVRHHLKNTIRQQIESPIFHEGWASYSEQLIDRLGYIKDPVQRLVGFKRQAWRAVRAMLDVGMRINKLTPEDAEGKLRNLGYTPSIVKNMVRHYMLTRGYQLCYTIGKYEIEKLEKRFLSKLGMKKFYTLLLNGGQIPFHLVKMKMEDFLCKKNS